MKRRCSETVAESTFANELRPSTFTTAVAADSFQTEDVRYCYYSNTKYILKKFHGFTPGEVV
jgi:hypothetical protein